MADVSERTARECLYTISEAGWLRRRTKPDGKVEYVCPEYINLDETAWN